MATSGTNVYFNIMEVIEEAYERAGKKPAQLTARHLDSARRSINDLFLRWSASEVNVWKIASGTTTSVASTDSYTVGTSGSPVIDIINVSVKNSSGNEIPLDFLSQADYQLLTDKDQEASLTASYTVFRNNNGVSFKVWPVPKDATLTYTYHTINYVEEVGNYDNDLDLPKRMLPALIAGLAWQLSLKRETETPNPGQETPDAYQSSPEFVLAKQRDLKVDYLETLKTAMDNDREMASFYAIPYLGMGR